MNRLFDEIGMGTITEFTGRTPPETNSVASVVLAENVEKSVTVPDQATVALFSSTFPFYCNGRGTATIPATTEFELTDATENSPSGYNVLDIETLSFISEESDNKINVTFYR